ncbi:MAG TPA: type II toxin-antitoxin system HicB family antitoxin [Candidatus Paceibacterota bacterium]
MLSSRNMAIREFTAVYQKRGKWFVAWIEEIPGVNTQGKTMRETKENLKEAVRLIIETNRELGRMRGADISRESLRIALPA